MSSSYRDSEFIKSPGVVDWEGFIEAHRERIERLAESELHSSWVFEAMLEFADEEREADQS